MAMIIKGGGDDFPNIPPAGIGPHNSVCCEVYDRGMVDDPKWGKKHKYWFVYQVEELIAGTGSDYDGKRKEVRIAFNHSMAPNSTLRQTLEAWRGMPMSQEEVDDGFDVEWLIGVSAMLFVGSHSAPDKNGRVYANVKGIAPPKVEMEPLDYVPIAERGKAPAEEEQQISSGSNGGAKSAAGKVPF